MYVYAYITCLLSRDTCALHSFKDGNMLFDELRLKEQTYITIIVLNNVHLG